MKHRNGIIPFLMLMSSCVNYAKETNDIQNKLIDDMTTKCLAGDQFYCRQMEGAKDFLIRNNIEEWRTLMAIDQQYQLKNASDRLRQINQTLWMAPELK